MTQWLTVEEVAEYLRTNPSTIYKLKQRGQIRGYRAGRSLIFDAAEVDADIKRGLKKGPTGQIKVRASANRRKIS